MGASADKVFRFEARVQPRAKRSKVAGRYGEALKLQVAAPPVDGAANEAVVALVADAFAVPGRSVRIVAGHSGRTKIVEIVDHDVEACRRRFEMLASPTLGVDIGGGRD